MSFERSAAVRARTAATRWAFAASSVLVASVVLSMPSAHAQTSVGLHQKYTDRLEGSEKIAALNFDAFGDQINLRDGGVQFNVADISVPGNSALPVELRRRFRVVSTLHPSGALGGFNDWDLDIPYMKGTFAAGTGWKVDGTPSDHRCSLQRPPKPQAGYTAKEYWDGYWLHAAGGGEQSVLASPNAALPVPTGATSYPWITKDFWRISCKASTANGYSGEGFVALAPDGVKYTFDWVITRTVASIHSGWTPAPGAQLAREAVYFLVSRVEDRFGNWVTYQYTGDKLQSITSNDGRQITLAYTGNAITLATASTGSWGYGYTGSRLSSVTRPDGSQWKYAATGDTKVYPSDDPDAYTYGRQCRPPDLSFGEFGYVVTHPSGAQASFSFGVDRHIRHNIPKMCNTSLASGTYASLTNYAWLEIPNYYDSLTLGSKQVTGPGLVSATWTYSYDIGAFIGAFASVCTPTAPQCSKTIRTEVVGPGGKFERYHFGAWYGFNEGQLLKKEMGADATHITRTETSEYIDDATIGAQVFPDAAGTDLLSLADDFANTKLRPQTATSITMDGATFDSSVDLNATTGAYSFDVFARPTSITKASSLGYSRAEQTAYSDNLAKWILGQVSSVRCMKALPTTCAGVVMSRTDYDTNAMPFRIYGPGTVSQAGKVQQTLTYNLAPGTDQTGTLATVKDGNNNITTFSNWKRGIPRSIKFPATAEAPTGAAVSAVVTDAGWITATVDENGYSTGYGYDLMGRLANTVYPTGDSVTWNSTTRTFAPVAVTEYGIPAGHWKQTITTGSGRKETYFDAMWRPLVVREYDTANVAGTLRFTRLAYDAAGRESFASYPGTTNALTVGIRKGYDALDRITQVDQDSELGVLHSTTEYLVGFKTRITNPRGYQTTTSYMAYDQPTTEWPVDVQMPQSAMTAIARDPFGKPTALSRANTAGTFAATRNYVYDDFQQLCKTIEPETKSTLMDYDNAGNLAWSAAGQALPSPSCDRASVPMGSRTTRSYDPRNRLITLRFPDGLGDQDWSYTPDGQVDQIITYNGLNHTDAVTNAYHYNKRRLLDGQGESVHQQDWYTYGIGYGYDGNGSLAVHSYPSGQSVSYLPNALGQPTQAGSYATGVSYYSNGAIKQFTYGNGVVHTLTQNVRQLPDTSRDAFGATEFLDDGYDYDANGNVAAISDGLNTSNAHGDRTMVYDQLDRLTSTTSPMFATSGSGTARYVYDVLDNLTEVHMPATALAARDHYYCYDAQWHLTNIKTGSCGGLSVIGLGYDPQGNLMNQNGVPYDFDFGNRLRSTTPVGTGKQTYRYDGHGRRVLVNSTTRGNLIYQYSASGQLMYQRDLRGGTNTRIDYISLGGSLVAEREQDIPTGLVTVRYQHTDALGSPVAVTDANRTEIERSEYEPFGKLLNRAVTDGPGYTGHVSDGATGLSYMQQRYYDPGIGRFLSVDPVTADGNTGSNFNRYWYANNNPYKFTDPDGRQVAIPWEAIGKIAAERGAQAGVASQVDSPAPGPGDVVAAGILIYSVGEIGYKIYQANKSPDLPTETVGTKDGEGGKTRTRENNGPLAPEHGGTGDAGSDFDHLTGGNSSPPPAGSTLPEGSRVGENGIVVRPGQQGEGPRIDIPANGEKPRETLHYPKPEEQR